MNKKSLALFGAIFMAPLLGACASETDVNEEVEPAVAEENQIQEEPVKSDTEQKDNNVGTFLNPYLAEDLNADVKVIYTNTNPGLKHEFSEDVVINIDEYQIVHVSNMNESSKSNFDEEDEGYVLTYKMTLVNDSDEDVYYAGGVSLLSDDGTEYIIPRQHLVDREQWLKDDSNDNFSQYSKGATYTGMNAHSMTKAQFDKLSSPTLKIDAFFLEDDVSKRIGEDAIFQIPFNDEGVEKAAVSSQLYQDKMTTDNIADKEVFFEETDMNETKEIDGVKITLNGVQYADLTPTEAYKDSFSDFGENGVVALTAKVTIENGSDTPFDKFFIDRKLIIDGNRGTMFNQGMLEPSFSGTVNPGDKDEFLTVFLFRKDEFAIFNEFEFHLGPLKDSEANLLFKEKTVTFDLPVEK
ncbi:DUF5068 domain-containing protein [Halalkalibacter krulwichiae]|uniref:Telomeric repeat-binding factor 2 n=1 Tax=Halalkalibacter krulwichiae TaxID=199441 RepID=A0A1X9MJA8_9BACI|nr:DUF5068 domain-containing protein [Halalkalibacter krulwichiae]ARK32884.1 hypothetical protein BkAM31D_25135 [Halalkalibacter krulwichiae]